MPRPTAATIYLHWTVTANDWIRPDLFWASNIQELEALVQKLFAEPKKLQAIPVEPPPYWALKALLKEALAP